jgi:hypothetical protein
MSFIDEYVADCKARATRLRAQLKTLESGELRLAERRPGTDWVDFTDREIERLKGAIAGFEAVVANPPKL